MATVHKRQRSGSNKWSEPQEFAASGVAVDVTNGDVRIGDDVLSSGTYNLILWNSDKSSYEGFMASSVTVSSEFKISGGGSLTTTANGDITLAPNGTGITKTSGFSTSHSLSSPADLGIGGVLEVTGSSYFDSLVRITGGGVSLVDVPIAGASYVDFLDQNSDPSDPGAGHSRMWQSDGTGSGADGDIMMKITDSGGTTKTTTLVDFSAI